MNTSSTSSQALANLQQFDQGQKSPSDLLSSAEQQYGTGAAQSQVQGLRGAIQNTTNLLNQVAPSVYGRTGNSLVTNAQATAQIGNAQAPINDQLNKEQTDYSNANQDYSDLEQKAQTLASANLGQQQNQQSYLQQVYQNLYGQEQNAAQQAEATREFNTSLAAQKAASAGVAGLNTGGNTSNPSSASSATRNPADIAFSLIQANKLGAAGWNAAAKYLQSVGVPVTRGSAGDIALNRYFNAAGFTDYMNSLKAEHLA